MSKQYRKIISLIIVFSCFSVYALPPVSYEDRLYYSREEFMQDEEGKLLFKLRAIGLKTKSRHNNLPAATNSTSAPVGKLFTSGYGGEASTSYFFTNNILAELSLAMIFLRSHNSTLLAISNNYRGVPPGKSKRILLFPLTATVLYSIAPYGGIQPYIGAGAHATYVRTGIKSAKIKNGFGPVIQGGVDLVAKDYTLINFDIKQYLFSPKITYKPPLTSSNISSKIKLNPLIISLGIGFKF